MSRPELEARVVPPGLPVAAATPEWITALCDALRAAAPALRDRPAAEIAGVLGTVGARFLDPQDPVRADALEILPSSAGLSPEMAEAVLDGMAADWTQGRLTALLEAELGRPSPLDGFVELGGPRRATAVGPRLCVQIVAGSVPGVGVTALLRSLLVKAPTLLKPGRGDVVLPVLFARALAEVDAGLASAAAVLYWPGGSTALESAALARAEVVTAYGSDRTVAELRARTPITARFVAYHHRVSVGVVGREALTGDALAATAADVARALALFDQRGCVSPQLVYVEEGGEASSEAFAEALARALRALEASLPGGPLEPAEASALQQARGTAELLAGSGEGRVLHGGRAAWTVLLEPRPEPLPPLAGRFARVRPLASLDALPERLAPLGSHLQTVGHAGLGTRLEPLAGALAQLGASRVAPFRQVAFPPPWWHHDGGGPLTDLVRWVDLEPE